MLQIDALICVRNGAATLARVLAHLAENAIRVHVLDQGSSDASVRILEAHRERPVASLTRLAFDGVDRLLPQLQWKAERCAASTADWIVHVRAEEILESRQASESLRAFIERMDQSSADVIACDEFVFVPSTPQEQHHGADFVERMRHYYCLPATPRIVRRSAGPPAWLAALANGAALTGHTLATETARNRHYLGLSLAHLRSRHLARVFAADELQRGAHRDRVATSEQFVQLPRDEQLLDLDRDGWCRAPTQQAHAVFHQPTRFHAPAAVAADATRAPFVLVVGVSRSGTTLLRMLLDAHPHLAMTPETHWLNDLMRLLATRPGDAAALRTLLRSEPHWRDMGVSDAELDRIVAAHDATRPADTVRAIYRAYLSRFPGKTRIGDKTPVHLTHIYDIVRLLPETRVVHIVRDGRDVALSYREVWFGPGKDPAAAATHWMWRIREARQQAQFLPHYLEVHYEDLVADAESVLRRIGEFIDLPYDPAQLRAHERAAERLQELTDLVHGTHVISAEQRRGIRQRTLSPPDRSRAERWRSDMSAHDVGEFERVAGDFLADLGYARGSDA